MLNDNQESFVELDDGNQVMMKVHVQMEEKYIYD
jgi:hypothetical protein